MQLSDFINQAIAVPFLDHGRDFTGWDCWGLLVEFFKLVHGITIESFEAFYSSQSQEWARIYDEQIGSWQEIKKGDEKPGDVAVFRGDVVHMGVVVKPGKMLHTEPKMGTYVESYVGEFYKRKFIGIYRHADLLA